MNSTCAWGRKRYKPTKLGGGGKQNRSLMCYITIIFNWGLKKHWVPKHRRQQTPRCREQNLKLAQFVFHMWVT